MQTAFFETIDLQGMDKVSFMNRTDTKYWFNYELLQELLFDLKDDYFILNIAGSDRMPYLTTYFDTCDNQMFAAHHNGKLNRYKVRRRSYLSSNISFLEVKYKTNKGRTIKNRIPTELDHKLVLENESAFLGEYSPYNATELRPVLTNEFTRLMLVNKQLNERCTIDFNIKFSKGEHFTELNDLVIVELKSDGGTSGSPLAKALLSRRIKIAGFSKYCVGRTVTDNHLKRNNFKSKIRAIEKTIQSSETLYTIN